MGKKVFHPTGGDKLTQQHQGDATNINKIMERHLRTGVLSGPGRPNGRQGQYLNMTGENYHEMLTRVQEAQGQFAAFPAKIRRRFSNNPENLLRFLQDDKNLAEAAELGLVDLDSLPPERKAQLEQMDLVKEADKEDYLEFQRWKQRRARDRQDFGDQFVGDEARDVPTNSDPEANPRKSAKKRTS